MSVAPSSLSPFRTQFRPLAVFALSLILLVAVFWDGLAEMSFHWEQAEFSHGYLIPLIAAAIGFRDWMRREPISLKSSTSGIFVLLAGLAAGGMGALAASYSLVQYAFIIALIGLIAAVLGWRSVRVLGPAIFYLSFMIPLPLYFMVQLSSGLQLISTNLGVAILRLFSIPTFVEGNVIDLGDMNLQVAEACSGLRYLFPLMSFSFLVAYLFRGAIWQRALLFLSAIPIAIFMNGLRIGVIGITVTFWGTPAAEGFLHLFEGWVVFVLCLAILFLEAAVLAHAATGQTLLQRLDLEFPSLQAGEKSTPAIHSSWQLVACLVLLVASAGLTIALPHRDDRVPPRQSLELFPDKLGAWQGRRIALDRSTLEQLKVDDYLSSDYANSAGAIVNLYVAYYLQQRNGAAIHSPHNCLPSGGWKVESTKRISLGSIGPAGQPLWVNRVLVRKGSDQMLIYYWFQERGRIITEEYKAKLLILKDGLIEHRTDGALVRLVTPFTGSEAMQADEQLRMFAQLAEGQLSRFVPN